MCLYYTAYYRSPLKKGYDFFREIEHETSSQEGKSSF